MFRATFRQQTYFLQYERGIGVFQPKSFKQSSASVLKIFSFLTLKIALALHKFFFKVFLLWNLNRRVLVEQNRKRQTSNFPPSGREMSNPQSFAGAARQPLTKKKFRATMFSLERRDFLSSKERNLPTVGHVLSFQQMLLNYRASLRRTFRNSKMAQTVKRDLEGGCVALRNVCTVFEIPRGRIEGGKNRDKERRRRAAEEG